MCSETSLPSLDLPCPLEASGCPPGINPRPPSGDRSSTPLPAASLEPHLLPLHHGSCQPRGVETRGASPAVTALCLSSSPVSGSHIILPECQALCLGAAQHRHPHV